MQTAYMSLGEACERLRIPPRTFRQLMADFGDLLEKPRPSADGKLQELSVDAVDTLQEILELRNRGVSVDAIRARLEAGPESLADVSDNPIAVTEATGGEAEVAATAEAPRRPGPEAAIDTPVSPAASPPEPDTAETPDATPMPAAGRPAVAQPAADVPDAALLAQQQELLGKLDELTAALSQSEKKRVDDRDRLLTALMRTQVEIQQLRYALAATASRRDRKQQSWVARWFA